MKKIISIILSAVVLLSASVFLPDIRAEAAPFNIDFKTTSKSIYLENLDTGVVVYEKDSNARRFPASTTKIMTYIITAEKINDLDKTYVTVKSDVLHQLDGTGSSHLFLQII